MKILGLPLYVVGLALGAGMAVTGILIPFAIPVLAISIIGYIIFPKLFR